MIRSFLHIGIAVSNLDQSIRFYGQHFGMRLIARESFGGKDYEKILDLEGARGEVALLAADSFNFELFEFAAPVAPEGNVNRPVCTPGISHFSVEVDDIEAAYTRMIAAGVRFHCPPLEFGEAGRATYGRDPDGNVFELVEPTSSKRGPRDIDSGKNST